MHPGIKRRETKMPQTDADMDEFNTPGVLRVVWETFAELSRAPQA